MKNLTLIINKAEKAGACEEELERIKQYKTFEEAKKDPKASSWACWYAINILEGRWPEAEEVIKQHPKWAFCYARYVIKGRWPEAEEVIIQSPSWAYYYARDLLKARWPEAEEVIRQDEEYWKRYCEKFNINNK